MKKNLRKKLTFAIVGLVVNWVVAYLRQNGVEVTPEESAAILDQAQNISFGIVGLFMIAQGIADHGKEAAKVAKNLLIFVLVGSLLTIGLPAYAQPEGPETIPIESTCEEKLAECNDCPICIDPIECEACPECPTVCEDITIKEVLLDKKLRAGVILLVAGIVGAVVPLFITPR
jgi:hypothetical protein